MALRPAFPEARAWPSRTGDAPADPHAETIDWVIASPPGDESHGSWTIRRPVYNIEFARVYGSSTVRELRRIGDHGRAGRPAELLIDVQSSIEGDAEQREYTAVVGNAPERLTITREETTATTHAGWDANLPALADESQFAPLVERLVRDRALTFLPPTTGPARGVIVRIRAFAPNPFEDSVVEEFRRRGWAVLSGSFATPLSTVGRYDFAPGTPLAVVAAPIARDMDRVSAERAYAFEAALAWLAERHPEVPTHPAVLVGFSAGALGVPTVAARMPGRFDAAVLVCGGADLLSICQRNSLARGLSVTMSGAPLPRPVLDSLCAEYLAASSLDPYATAPALIGTPVLMLQAARDRDVPRDTGDLLYERLGRPERWMYDGGHAWVFLLLPRLKGDIARWIEHAVGPHAATTTPGSGISITY